MPLLTICIPTYKRLPLLKTLLEGLLPQAQALGIMIQLNDNCSNDGTIEYLGILSTKYSCLRFGVNPVTVPIDENMFLAMNSAESRYVYPLGDDDFLPDGALASIVEELAREPDILVLSGIFTDSSLNPKKNLLADELQGRVFDDPRQAFSSLWDKMPFGSFVMRRDVINEVTFRKYLGTCHAYTGIAWEWLNEKFTNSKNASVMCMKRPTVMLRGGEKSWRDYKARIYLHEIPRWFGLLPPIYAEEVAATREKYLRKNGALLSLLAFRRSGQLTHENCRHYMSHFSGAVQRKAAIVSYIPPLVARVLRFFIKMYI